MPQKAALARALALAALVLMPSFGCRQQLKQRKYRAEAGIAREIHTDSGVVSMEWIHRRTGESKILTGQITQETEIFINGVSARVEDVHAGDRVEVVVYPVEEDIPWIVTRVAVERAEGFLLTQPATPPPSPDAR